MELFIIFASFILAVVVCVLARKRTIFLEIASCVASLAALAISVEVAQKVAAHGTYAPQNWFSVDALGAVMMLIIGTVGLAATTYSVAYLRRELAKKIIGFK